MQNVGNTRKEQHMNTNCSKLLVEARSKLNMSQKHLSELVGLGTSQLISNIESGRADIPPRQVKPLSLALQLSPEQVLEAIFQDKQNKLKKAAGF